MNRPHLEKRHGAVQLIVKGQPFLMLAGELHNSAASALGDMEPIFDKLAALNLNTALVPLSWELVEPAEGQFDFRLPDDIVRAARERALKLVLLWFGTMKNATSCYTPEWVKTDLRRFPRAEATPGTPGWTISPFGSDILACDSRAFARLMCHLREQDAARQTVLMVQVENESGILNAARDHSAAAERAFAQPAPGALTSYLAEHRADLRPELREAWEDNGAREAGTWRELFGRDADEVFMGWHIARFVDQVAAAGRAEYDLPMFANAWLIGGPGFLPGTYPSGGPLSRLRDVWQVAAPHIDFIAPDIYRPDFRAVCADYATGGNPLFVPEAGREAVAAANAVYVLGRHDALGFSPFGIEDIDATHSLAETYGRLAGLLPLIADAQGTGRMTAFLQESDEESWLADLGGYRFRCRTRASLAKLAVPGHALLIDEGEGVFTCLGRNVIFTFAPLCATRRTAELVAVDEGEFRNGAWQPRRRLNGDETAHGTGILLGERLTTCRFRLFSY